MSEQAEWTCNSGEMRDRLRRAVARLEELRDRPSLSFAERSRLDGKIEGVKLAASYMEEGERIFRSRAFGGRAEEASAPDIQEDPDVRVALRMHYNGAYFQGRRR